MNKMYRLKSLVFLSSLLLHFSVVLSQSVTAPPAPSNSASSTSSREPITRTVAVGRGDHVFEPDVTQAEVGDYVEFRFYPTNHSVVRAAYEHPCVPFELIETDKVGFTSGFQPVDAVLSDPPKWSVRINDSDPIFYYCSAPASCIKFGMVGVINPNASTHLDDQRDKAKSSSFMLQPGENWPDESTSPEESASRSSSSGTSPTSSPGSSTSGAPASTATAPRSGLSGGAIAGIAIGGAAVILMVGVLIYLCGRNRSLSDIIRSRGNHHQSVDFEGSGAQYVQAVPKHMSGMTMVSGRPESGPYMHLSPALPGYMGPHDGLHSLPRSHYVPSDALSPATPVVRSQSPGSTVAPAYTKSPPLPPQTPVEHLGDGPHEMDAGAHYQRSSGIQKGGVERYT